MSRNRQQGIVLVLTLILLVVLTLFVLSSTRLSTGNLRIIGNMQAKKNVEAIAQQGVEQVLSSVALFIPNRTAAVTFTPAISGINVAVAARDCIRWTTVKGSSEAGTGGFSETDTEVTGGTASAALWDTFWNVRVTVNDTITSSSTAVNQGVKIRFPPGNC